MLKAQGVQVLQVTREAGGSEAGGPPASAVDAVLQHADLAALLHVAGDARCEQLHEPEPRMPTSCGQHDPRPYHVVHGLFHALESPLLLLEGLALELRICLCVCVCVCVCLHGSMRAWHIRARSIFPALDACVVPGP